MTTKIYIMKWHPNVDGSFSVYLRISHNGYRFVVSTGLNTFGEIKNGEFPQNEPNAKIKTKRLKYLLSAIDVLCIENKTLSGKELQEKINTSLLGKAKPKTPMLKDYIEEFAKIKTGGTRTLYMGTLKKVIAYGGNIPIGDVTVKWLNGFDSFCAKTMSINGRAIHLRNLRAVFNYAIKNDYTANYPFRSFKIEHETTRKRSLTVEDVKELLKFPCEPFQEEYRDIFMLMIYLIGINAVDLFSLRHSDIIRGRIEYRRAKTKRLYSIKIEPEARKILDKYKGEEYLLNIRERYKDYKDYLHHLNDGLKSIGKVYKDGFKTTGKSKFSGISSYWSRHTWATIAYNAGVQLDTISLALGHSLGKGALVTEIYIKPSLELVDKANRKVIDLIVK